MFVCRNVSCARGARCSWRARSSRRARTRPTARTASASCLPRGARRAAAPSPARAAPGISIVKDLLSIHDMLLVRRFISFEGRHWHSDCFVCALCKQSMAGKVGHHTFVFNIYVHGRKRGHKRFNIYLNNFLPLGRAT